MGQVEQQLALAYADAVKQLLAKAKVAPEHIKAIGCHGQTIRHRPYVQFPFTYQIGDMFRLAAETQIRVIADFRRKDMAYGGQGAPLVPAFHKAIFAKPNSYRAILNIGGIANVTLLQPGQPVRGFDTGPGNGLMDNWIQQQALGLYDKDGLYAASGVDTTGFIRTPSVRPLLSVTRPQKHRQRVFQSTVAGPQTTR